MQRDCERVIGIEANSRGLIRPWRKIRCGPSWRLCSRTKRGPDVRCYPTEDAVCKGFGAGHHPGLRGRSRCDMLSLAMSRYADWVVFAGDQTERLLISGWIELHERPG